MKSTILWKLYLPLFIFIILIILVVFSEHNNEELFIINFKKFGLTIDLPISLFILKKLLLLMFGLFSLLSYLFFDYSIYFPQKIEMAVFFDKEGIVNCLSYFSKDELNNMHIVSQNHEKYQSDYYNQINFEINRLFRTNNFTITNTDVHSEGQITFIVEKTHGIQNYFIRHAKGELCHFIEKPNSRIKEFCTYFDLHRSSADKLEPTLSDIVFKNRIIIKPRFKQIITEKIKPHGTKFNHTLCACTILKMLPYPRFSNTLYLYEVENVGLIPIGYAVYR